MVLIGIIYLFFVPFRWHKSQNFAESQPSSCVKEVDHLWYWWQNRLRVSRSKSSTNVFSICESSSRALKTFFAIFSDLLTPFSPRFLRKSLRPTACIVLSETIKDFFPSQIVHCLTNNLISLRFFYWMLYGQQCFWYQNSIFDQCKTY